MEYTKIKTFNQACKATGKDPKNLPDVSNMEKGLGKWVIANYKMAIIAEALNGEWKADFNNSDQIKYYPYFYWDGSSGFRYGGYVVGFSSSTVGARLCYKSWEIAKYAATTFISLYKIIMG